MGNFHESAHPLREELLMNFLKKKFELVITGKDITQ
jgi:hypothetical protein